MSVPKKRGRKPKPYVCQDGTHVNGLRRRRHDGRWILADGRTFSEADEWRAVERFREMAGADLPKLGFEDSAAWAVQHGFTFVGGTIAGRTPEQRLWHWVADQIRTRSKYVAAVTGIEQIAFLPELRPPEPLPSPRNSAGSRASAHSHRPRSPIRSIRPPFMADLEICC